MASSKPVQIMDEASVRRALARISREILERNGGPDGLVLMGIRRRGDLLARLLHEEILSADGHDVPLGALDITLYRDDLATVGPRPLVGETQLPPGGIDDATVVLVDDVLFTGRTVRAALNELMDYGRPARIILCVLADRGGRELPIQADIVGRHVETLGSQRVEVRVPPLDDTLAVEIEDVENAG
ncbi:MAG TPA: bifunctional pyr operon transcriptional regulator/uracil phosphoribosyltransferase PyrR [Longimicrobiales bacterium]|nr:bifunctional pyr operon transcriptional regulator/uracil phosphoribosyltransferase PyrR [Longimicrobiales bacterium]